MTPRQIALVQASWQRVRPAGGEVAARFYARLFERDPSLAPLFRGEMEAQGRKLIAALDFVVEHLAERPGRLPALQQLARRHVYYGVQPAHYDSVGEALGWTLAQGLGEAAGSELLQAWAAAYDEVAAAMKQAAWPAPPLAPEWLEQAG